MLETTCNEKQCDVKQSELFVSLSRYRDAVNRLRGLKCSLEDRLTVIRNDKTPNKEDKPNEETTNGILDEFTVTHDNFEVLNEEISTLIGKLEQWIG